MKFSTPFTLAATTLFMMGSTDAHLRGQRSLETTDDVGGDCTGEDMDPWPDATDFVPCCAGLDLELEHWDGNGGYYYRCLNKEAWKPIPKQDLKCSGSDYSKCLTGYIRPFDGVWVLEGEGDPECINWPETSEQLCNDCAGGCAWEEGGEVECSDIYFPTGNNTYCKPPNDQRSLETTDDVGGDCTDRGEDPWASGSEVPCCDGLEEQLNNWDGAGPYYYLCSDKDASKPIPRKD